MKFLGLVALIFAACPAQADQIDPACSHHQGVSSLNPFGARALQVLNKCVKVYCGPTVKIENVRANIKSADDILFNYHKHNVAFSAAVDEYQKSCRALMRKFCQACPLMDAVTAAVIGVQAKSADVEASAALLRQRENFSNVSDVITRGEGDAACGSQISASVKQTAELHNSLTLRFANTKCDQ